MSSRSSSALPRQAGSESKNNQDVSSAGSKPGKSSGGGSSSFSRGSRRREPAQGSLSGLNPNRPGPRTKTGANKKPLQRGYYDKNDKTFKNSTPYQIDEADECEIGSIFNPGRKKQNYNHLLNFQYDSRGHAASQNRGNNYNRGYNKPARRKFQDVGPRVKYDHTHYLQANCQFIVRDDQDYSVQMVDPDKLVDWDMIEQVELRVCSDDKTSCPICLFPPVAAKMSNCGHVFCWSCILHYLALSDDDNRPCPICQVTMTKHGLKSVKILTQHNYTQGEMVSMTLMKRERNSLFAVPATNNFIVDFPGIDSTDVDKKHCKLIKASAQEVLSLILERERRELEFQWQEEMNQPESCFVQEAIQLLDKRQLENSLKPVVKKKLSTTKVEIKMPEIQNLSLVSPTETIHAEDPFADEENANTTENRPRNVSGVSSDSVSSTEDVTEIADEGVTLGDLDISTVQAEPAAGQPRQVFYFYQSSDGQPLFLHALNVQMLVKQYGALEKCPTVIKAKILEKEGSVMTEELRDRLRYLRHLPVPTNFEVAELEMNQILSEETMKLFKDQVEKRKRNRDRKLKDEKRREKKIKYEEDRLMGFPGRMRRVESELVTKYKENDGHGQAHDTVDQYPAMASSSENMTTNPDSSSAPAFSFANITRSKPVSAVKPSGSPTETVTSSSGPTWSCLGSVKPMARSRPAPVAADSDQDEENGDYVPPPARASLGDTLAAALERQVAAGGVQGGAQTKGKKGKKGRGKTVLLSGAARPMI